MTRTIQEGTTAGVLGAVTVAVWFLLIDTLAGYPLRTPSVLGEVLLFQNAEPATELIRVWAVVAYTCFHLGAFVLLGLVAAKLVDLAEREAVWRFALLMLFVVFEVFFYGLLQIGMAATRGLFPFWSVLSANTLAALAMAGYLYRKHPALREAFRASPLGA